MQVIPELGLTVPNGWGVSTIGEHTLKIGSGATPRGGSSVYVEDGVALIRSQNVYDHSFKSEGLAFIDESAARALRSVTLHKDDVLINITGDSILRTTIVPPKILPARVNQHVSIVRVDDSVNPIFIQKWLSTSLMKGYMLGLSSGGTRKAITKAHLESLPIPVPPLTEQKTIAATLGALDDKIESNMKQRALCRQLGSALVARQVEHISKYSTLEDYCLTISRGVTPKYFKDEDVNPVRVLNQKCIRDGWVSPELARLMLPRTKSKDAAIAEYGDLLVNSTGQGTLGRVARWSFQESIYVDSHVSVVKPNPDKISPILFSYLVFPKQPEIEGMAEGSTGQTELSPSRLASLEVPQIPRSEQERLEPQLLTLEDQAHTCFVQSGKLAALRDALLPELMSGRIRVSEARDVVSEAVDADLSEPREDEL